MLENLRIWVFPVLLLLGAAVLFFHEFRHHQLEGGHSSRLIRRLLGAIVIASIGIMLHFGKAIPAPGAPRQVVFHQFYYWMSVLGLVALAMALAVWDVFSSLRSLRGQFETIAADEIRALRDQLNERGMLEHTPQPHQTE